MAAERTLEAMKATGIECGLTLASDQPHLFDMYRDSNGSRWGFIFERISTCEDWEATGVTVLLCVHLPITNKYALACTTNPSSDPGGLFSV